LRCPNFFFCFFLFPPPLLCACIPLVPWSADDANYYSLPLLWVSPAARRQHVLVVASRAMRFAHNTRLSRPYFFISLLPFFASLLLLTFLFYSLATRGKTLFSPPRLSQSNRIVKEQTRLERWLSASLGRWAQFFSLNSQHKFKLDVTNLILVSSTICIFFFSLL
jgi:hypothetical protein